MRRASAIVTEIGASIGHLATIARELRIPAVFGAAGAMERLPEGTVVTVDAGDRTVYRGVLGPLLASRACSTELEPGDPEYVALRSLLRWIMPLDLIDPDSSTFSVENCRTYHEIIHFAHERSIEELLKIQEHGAGLKTQHVRKLEIGARSIFSCSTSVEESLRRPVPASGWMMSFRSLSLHSCAASPSRTSGIVTPAPLGSEK